MSVISEYGKIWFSKAKNMVMCSVPPIGSVTLSGWSNMIICNIPNGFYSNDIKSRTPICPQNTTDFVPIYIANGEGKLLLENQSGLTITTANMLSTNATWRI